MIGYIYTLHGKTENDIFYVGATTNPKKRHYAHRVNFPYYKYDCDVTLSIIEEVSGDDFYLLRRLEAYWMHQFIAWGFALVNYQLSLGFDLRLRSKYIQWAKEDEIIRQRNRKLIEVLENYTTIITA
jgi:hypothetical protein